MQMDGSGWGYQRIIFFIYWQFMEYNPIEKPII